MKQLEYGRAICYSGYRKGQNPMNGDIPSYEQVKEDIKILANEGYQYIRMYDPSLHAEHVIHAILELDLPIQVALGMDCLPECNNPNSAEGVQNYSKAKLEQNAARNDNELLKLIHMAKEYPDIIKMVSIGNENTPCWGTRIITKERLYRFAEMLKNNTMQLVTYNEGALEWQTLQELGELLDVISVHSYPLWTQKTIDEAVAFNIEQYESVKKCFPDKQIVFGEIGWATGGTSSKISAAQISLENQKRYISEITSYLDKEKIIGFLFEAFDEEWKSQDDGVERHWGLFDQFRVRK